ncbi:DEAD/DEAH box helicase [Paenibacillus sp. JX-17]|uniref:DEAD/DEAH box helicase n=1 Tax=Paenibacillus lacisoli TaxID=3064525 RepID=A0ABT9CHY3_9BACL|nr:DEAD/DEAH box helicase [Paenibacillus sp. JX-17]MDO7908183.1 DEAD/DEAH box helicase [Paenibacillus sp. JX-17]
MNPYVNDITIGLFLTSYGDALVYGSLPDGRPVPGLQLKQRLFAWHAPSFYGTELELQQVEEMELAVLPAEQVIPFLAEPALLAHLSWTWDEATEPLLAAAPPLAESINQRHYIPSFKAFREGKLQWLWDEDRLDWPVKSQLRQLSEDIDLMAGLTAAYSAAVFQRHYGTEAEAADLRREYPQLFAGRNPRLAGLDAKTWLVELGWKADTAPFRPLLQLLEPGEEEPAWRLQLVLQDKLDPVHLVPVHLAASGEAAGSWPDSWSASIVERSSGWLERLRAGLPRERWAGLQEDVLSRPLDHEAAWQFLTSDSRRLLDLGWQVLLPAWWESASRKKPRLRAKVQAEEAAEQQQSGESLFGLNSLIAFDWRIAIGDVDLSEEEFLALVDRNERLVRFRGQWIPLDPVLLAQIRRAMDGVDRSKGLSFQDVLHLHLLKARDEAEDGEVDEEEEDERDQVQLEVELNEHLLALIGKLRQQKDLPPLQVPEELHATLRSYQQEGFTWLAFMRRFGLGACLADDMGLGKTIQFITYLLHVQGSEHSEAGSRMPALLICPTSVLGNWQKEMNRFAPTLRVGLHYGSRRHHGEAFRQFTEEVDVILTSYATATLDLEELALYEWTAICLDEAQNIKNAQTKQSMAVRSLPTVHRIALTGTPIENRLAELWSLYDFMNPGYLGSMRAFQNRFGTAIEQERDEQRIRDLQKLVQPFMLRRKKKDPNIQLDLPEKNEMKTYVSLTPEQSALYDQTVQELMTQVKELQGMQRKGAILSALTKLKQLCDHPVLLTKESADVPETDEELQAVNRSLVGRSSKLERLLAMVRELREEGERCLIFTQYIGMGEMLQEVLSQELGEPVLYLHGGISKSARDRMIEQFQSQTLPAAEQPSIFILSIKAGGVGLNLTAANHVFHFDRWWNPAVENQATDRAYRMGQTKDVQVHKFIALGTLEERIDEMLENKQQLSDNIISSTEGWITELSTEDLKDLITLRRNWE